jgi:uncharacterized protein YbbC (DUF1343 family)
VNVEGNILKPAYQSFVGNYPLCVRYGLTAGEVALMANDQTNWNCKLQVVRCDGWERRMQFPETGRLWVMPSLGIPRFDTALLYSGTCIFEGTNLSEGRGTTVPFEIVGAPFIHAQKLADEMNLKKLPGVVFRPVYFKPSFSKFQGELCSGVQLHVTNTREFRPVEAGVTLMYAIKHNYELFSFLPPIKMGSRPFIDLLCGDKLYREEPVDIPALLEQFRDESHSFKHMKQQYHLY